MNALISLLKLMLSNTKHIPGFIHKNEVYLLAGKVDDAFVNEILERARFYIPGIKIDVVRVEENEPPIKVILSRSPILVVGEVKIRKWWPQKILGNVYNVDYKRTPHEGWNWHTLADYLFFDKKVIKKSKDRFIKSITNNLGENKDKCYIFGTGKSLEKAVSHDWSDGYRVVCNTIVRDEELWSHINPHYIVAGDAIYHFGHSEFSRAFRKDLLKRLTESNAKFIYPASFHALVFREMNSIQEQLIPVPNGTSKEFYHGLIPDFKLPSLGNVLPLLLLPVACTLSKNTSMLGFDGRAPDDKLFWSNSIKHSYPELMGNLQNAHPKFFEHYLKDQRPENYTKNVHGDELDSLLTQAELIGWKFILMSKSWTKTLQKRFVSGLFDESRK
jgi:hypothetical protein